MARWRSQDHGNRHPRHTRRAGRTHPRQQGNPGRHLLRVRRVSRAVHGLLRRPRAFPRGFRRGRRAPVAHRRHGYHAAHAQQQLPDRLLGAGHPRRSPAAVAVLAERRPAGRARLPAGQVPRDPLEPRPRHQRRIRHLLHRLLLPDLQPPGACGLGHPRHVLGARPPPRRRLRRRRLRRARGAGQLLARHRPDLAGAFFPSSTCSPEP